MKPNYGSDEPRRWLIATEKQNCLPPSWRIHENFFILNILSKRRKWLKTTFHVKKIRFFLFSLTFLELERLEEGLQFWAGLFKYLHLASIKCRFRAGYLSLMISSRNWPDFNADYFSNKIMNTRLSWFINVLLGAKLGKWTARLHRNWDRLESPFDFFFVNFGPLSERVSEYERKMFGSFLKTAFKCPQEYFKK